MKSKVNIINLKYLRICFDIDFGIFFDLRERCVFQYRLFTSILVFVALFLNGHFCVYSCNKKGKFTKFSIPTKIRLTFSELFSEWIYLNKIDHCEQSFSQVTYIFFLSSDFNSYLTAKTTVTDKMVQGYSLLFTSLGKELKFNFQSNICGCSFVILQAPL